MSGQRLTGLLRGHIWLLGVMAAALLISVSMGAYTNWDSQLEYEAAQNVLLHGYPTVTTGLLINQPPLGFYLDAPVFALFGLSYSTAVWISAAYALASVALVYALGTLLYGKRTALVASALFAVTPWHAYISKIFLIDNQALFFSLLFLIIAVLAIRQNSEPKLLVAGIFFAAAFLTKLFAVFMLIPLLLILFFERAKFKVTARKVAVFLAPTLISQATWFGGIANQHFWGVYFSSDFTHPVLIANPNPLFLPRLLLDGGGWYLFGVALLSLALTAAFWRQLAGHRWADAVCLGTVAVIMGLDLLLVFGFHRLVPYVSAFKYNYFTLPFFCLLAASLADKGALLLAKTDPKRLMQGVKLAVLAVGAVLVLASLVWSLQFLTAWSGFVAFEVDSAGNYFPFDVYSAPFDSAFFVVSHDVALVLVVACLGLPLLGWMFRKPIRRLLLVLSS